jgi:hypothetical protein
MPAPPRRVLVYRRKLLALIFLIAPGLTSCTNGPTPEQQLDAAFNGKPEDRLKVAKFEGQVTIDGQPPGPDNSLLHIFLLDADKFRDPKTAPCWQAAVDAEGHFSFTTYLTGDGAPVGKYVAVFVDPSVTEQVKGPARRGARAPGFGGVKHGKDKLKNLFNDPDQNIKRPQFVIDLQPPGITNQTFNLEVAGKEELPVPGKYAVTDVAVAEGAFKFRR